MQTYSRKRILNGVGGSFEMIVKFCHSSVGFFVPIETDCKWTSVKKNKIQQRLLQVFWVFFLL